MPLSVMVPITACFGLSLPTTSTHDVAYDPHGEVITISGIKDEVDVLSSLQKPKKVCHPHLHNYVRSVPATSFDGVHVHALSRPVCVVPP